MTGAWRGEPSRRPRLASTLKGHTQGKPLPQRLEVHLMHFDLQGADAPHADRLLASVVMPRPIALVTTLSADGGVNTQPRTRTSNGYWRRVRRNVGPSGCVGYEIGALMCKTSVFSSGKLKHSGNGGLFISPSHLQSRIPGTAPPVDICPTCYQGANDPDIPTGNRPYQYRATSVVGVHVSAMRQ